MLQFRAIPNKVGPSIEVERSYLLLDKTYRCMWNIEIIYWVKAAKVNSFFEFAIKVAVFWKTIEKRPN